MSETLADLIALAMKAEGVDSGRALGDKAKQRGLVLTHTQINHMLGGTYRHKPKQSTIQAIATLARVSSSRVFKAANVPQPGPPFAQELPPNVDRLEPHQRKAVIEVMRAFLTDVETTRENHPAVTSVTGRARRGSVSDPDVTVPLAADDSPDESSEVEAQQDEP